MNSSKDAKALFDMAAVLILFWILACLMLKSLS